MWKRIKAQMRYIRVYLLMGGGWSAVASYISAPLFVSLLGLVVSTAVWGESSLEDVLQRLENISQSLPAESPRPDILVIEIDDTTLRRLSGPFETDVFLICLTNIVANEGPAVVGLDYTFPFRDREDRRGSCPLVGGEAPTSFADLEAPVISVAGRSFRDGQMIEIEPQETLMPRRARNFGHGSLEISLDREVIRTVPLYYDARDEFKAQPALPAFALAVWARWRLGMDGIGLRGAIGACRTGSCPPELAQRIADKTLRIKYEPPEVVFDRISAEQVLRLPRGAQVPGALSLKGLVKDRVVLIGNTSSIATDLYQQPIDGLFSPLWSFLGVDSGTAKTPGVLIHAQILNALDKKLMMRGLPAWAEIVLVAVSFILMLAILPFVRSRQRAGERDWSWQAAMLTGFAGFLLYSLLLVSIGWALLADTKTVLLPLSRLVLAAATGLLLALAILGLDRAHVYMRALIVTGGIGRGKVRRAAGDWRWCLGSTFPAYAISIAADVPTSAGLRLDYLMATIQEIAIDALMSTKKKDWVGAVGPWMGSKLIVFIAPRGPCHDGDLKDALAGFIMSLSGKLGAAGSHAADVHLGITYGPITPLVLPYGPDRGNLILCGAAIERLISLQTGDAKIVVRSIPRSPDGAFAEANHFIASLQSQTHAG